MRSIIIYLLTSSRDLKTNRWSHDHTTSQQCIFTIKTQIKIRQKIVQVL